MVKAPVLGKEDVDATLSVVSPDDATEFSVVAVLLAVSSRVTDVSSEVGNTDAPGFDIVSPCNEPKNRNNTFIVSKLYDSEIIKK